MSHAGVSLDELLSRFQVMPPEALEEVYQESLKTTGTYRFIPNPGPQTEAYFSQADVLLYGGEAGGGKSALLAGLALSCHKRSLLMRRESVQLNALVDETVRMYGSRKGFNGSYPQSLETDDDRLIEFGSCQHAGDELKWAGQAHDLLGFDEGALFMKQQVRTLFTWVRSVDPKQRTRIVIATNPPTTSEGDWLVEMFAPWLDVTHPNPAKQGELRWFVTDDSGKDIEVPSPEPIDMDGRKYIPMSRTFIRARVSDNPFLARTDYQSKLDSLPEPFRSAFRDGNFMVARQDDLKQVIPTEWIRAAMARWVSEPPFGVPMCAIGVDVAQGGGDNTVLAARYDGWFAPLEVIPGIATPYGKDVAGLVVAKRRDGAKIIIDMGGGYGGAAYEHLVDNDIECVAYKGSEKSTGRTSDRKLKFVLKRDEAYWRLREALDPSQPGGSPIFLPNDPELMSDLTAARFEIDGSGIRLQSKKDTCTRLGRSPDKGDAVVMAWFDGNRMANFQGGIRQNASANNRRPAYVSGHQNRR